MNPRPDTVVIERLHPDLDGGRYPVKRVEGDDLIVEGDIFKDGHDHLRALLKWRKQGESLWRETEMVALENDRWRATFPLRETGFAEYTVEAWGDFFETWRAEFAKKYDAGLRDLDSERLEGANLATAAAARAKGTPDAKILAGFAAGLREAGADATRALLDTPEFLATMRSWPDRSYATEYQPCLRVWVDRRRALFGAWYEFFPRSAEGKAEAGSTFRDCLERIDDAKAMGFDIVYFPPIHPIGETKRKGRNNSLTCEPGEPGVPYAIGNHRQGVNGGGHMDVAPELGTLEDFRWLVGEVKKRGMEIALDFAINCSPDHPYVAAHPEWFFKRPDGTIKYAENPPKKYEDVYPLNFHNPDWRALWKELRDVVLFWCGQGVRMFRVDNPHTKPVAFWEWLIGEVQTTFPDAIFLSEAFTRPKMMRVLAKAGFTQSYTYFTWRNNKAELMEYFTELTRSEMVDYFRPNLFTNTPDILPFFLQEGGRPAFQIRAFLAATLGTSYGIYSGFELCENAALPGREEYLDSEKYQFKGRDWNAPGNIKEFLTHLNRARTSQRALQTFENLKFLKVESDWILGYLKATPGLDNVIVAIVSLHPHQPNAGWVNLPLEQLEIGATEKYQMEDLLTGEHFFWSGARNFVAFDPGQRVAHLFRLRRWQGRELEAEIYQ